MQEKPSTGELTQQEIERFLWKAADVLRGAVRPDGYGNYTLPLLFFKRLSDVYLEESQGLLEKFGSEEIAAKQFHRFLIPEGCLWGDIRRFSQNVGQKLNDSLAQIAKSNPLLDGVINRTDFNNQNEIPPDRLIRLIEHLSKLKLGKADVTPDILGNVYEYLLKAFNEVAPLRAGEFYTPREVVRTMVGVLDPVEGCAVYDPCCGSGEMLIESHHHLLQFGKDPKKLFLHGQEINGDTWAIAMMNIMLHDMEAELRQGNSFIDPKFVTGSSLKKFDIVIANPMWNQDGYDDAFYDNDPWGRFRFGAPPKSSADWGWVQHIQASLRGGGRAAVVLDKGSIFRGSNREKNIRKGFVENDLIEAVFLLPDNLFYNTSAPAIILLLNQHKPAERRGQVLLVDASAYFVKEKPKNVMTDEGIVAISDAYRLWETRDKFSKVVNLQEIQAADYSLNPWQFVESEPIKYRPKDVKTIAELADEVFAGFSPKPEERKKYGKYLLLGGRNIKDGVLVRTDADSYVDDIPRDSFLHAIALPGDVIISALFDKRKIYVFGDDDPPAVVNKSCAIIRSSQYGDYIGSYLRTIEGQRDFLDKASKVTKGASISYLSLASLRSIQVPILPIAELSLLGDVSIQQSTKQEQIFLKLALESKNAEIKALEESKNAEIEALKANNDKIVRFYEDRILALESGIETIDLLNRIRHGETATLEFKASLRWNMDEKRIDKNLQKPVLKTIVAFCNTNGGDLLIGIDDNGITVGIERDGFSTPDEFLLHLTSLLQDRIEPNIADLVEYKMLTLDGKKVCYVTCIPSGRDVWLKAHKNSPEQFFVRSGPSSRPLVDRELVGYIKDHFK